MRPVYAPIAMIMLLRVMVVESVGLLNNRMVVTEVIPFMSSALVAVVKVNAMTRI